MIQSLPVGVPPPPQVQEILKTKSTPFEKLIEIHELTSGTMESLMIIVPHFKKKTLQA